MQPIAPDVLAELRGLSTPFAATALGIGLLLWLFGWRWHRFWLVVSLTIAAGVVGLQTGRASGGHLMALALLMAVAAGVLAVELARVVAFAAGGVAFWLAVRAVFPKADDLWICFLVGGIVSALLYRLWIMALTSFVGALLGAYATLMLLATHRGLDAVAWAESNRLSLNAGVVAATVLGVLAQAILERLRKERPKDEAAKDPATSRPRERQKSRPAAPDPLETPVDSY
jgi:hypothetical protein